MRTASLRLSGNSVMTSPRSASAKRRRAALATRWPPSPFSRGGGGRLVAVELEEVVGSGDESPFRSARGSAAALEASHLAVELQLPEDGLDRGLSSPVERAAVWGRENATHEVIEPTGPARPWSTTEARVG